MAENLLKIDFINLKYLKNESLNKEMIEFYLKMRKKIKEKQIKSRSQEDTFILSLEWVWVGVLVL